MKPLIIHRLLIGISAATGVAVALGVGFFLYQNTAIPPVFDEKNGVVFVKQEALSDMPQAEPAVVFSLALASPARSFHSLAAFVQQHDVSLAEGVKGIHQAKLESWTGHTDLEKAADELLAGPLRVTITEKAFVIRGTASSSRAVTEWFATISGTTAEGMIRRQNFYKGENTRLDVIAGDEAQEVAGPPGWNIRSYSSGALVLGSFGRRYAIGSDTSMLLKAISAPEAIRGVGEGTFDIVWTLHQAPWLSPMIGQTTGKAFWKARSARGETVVDWMVQ